VSVPAGSIGAYRLVRPGQLDRRRLPDARRGT
jgi:hypothetical protein